MQHHLAYVCDRLPRPAKSGLNAAARRFTLARQRLDLDRNRRNMSSLQGSAIRLSRPRGAVHASNSVNTGQSASRECNLCAAPPSSTSLTFIHLTSVLEGFCQDALRPLVYPCVRFCFVPFGRGVLEQ
jgi:hypothetical protein